MALVSSTSKHYLVGGGQGFETFFKKRLLGFLKKNCRFFHAFIIKSRVNSQYYYCLLSILPKSTFYFLKKIAFYIKCGFFCIPGGRPTPQGGLLVGPGRASTIIG
jgi:hypothetical protein